MRVKKNDVCLVKTFWTEDEVLMG